MEMAVVVVGLMIWMVFIPVGGVWLVVEDLGLAISCRKKKALRQTVICIAQHSMTYYSKSL